MSLTVNIYDTTADTFEIYGLKRDWVETQATWNVAAGGTNWDVAGAQGSSDRGSTILGTLTAPATGLKTFTMNAAGVALVQSWVANPAGNFGLTVQNYISAANSISFNSREVAPPNLRPMLTVTYVPASTTWSFQDGVFPDVTYAGTRDTRIAGNFPNTNLGSATGLVADGSPLYGTLLKWDLSAIPAGSIIRAVTLTVNVTEPSTDTFEIYQLRHNWQEIQATWNAAATGKSWQIPGAQGSTDRGTTVLGTLTASTTGLTSFELNAAGVAVVQSWINNPATNFGITIQDYTSAPNNLGFDSREIGAPTLRPMLTVTFQPGVSQARSARLSSQSATLLPAATSSSLPVLPSPVSSGTQNVISGSDKKRTWEMALESYFASVANQPKPFLDHQVGRSPPTTAPRAKIDQLSETFGSIEMPHWPFQSLRS